MIDTKSDFSKNETLAAMLDQIDQYICAKMRNELQLSDIISAVQALSNSITGHRENQLFLWKKQLVTSYPLLILGLLESADQRLLDSVCVLIYNSFTHNPELLRFVIEKAPEIFIVLLRLVENHDLDNHFLISALVYQIANIGMDPTLIWDDESAINFLRYLDACLARKLDMGLSISISQQCFERLIERFRLNRQLLTTGEPVVTDIDELHRVGDELLLLVQIFTNYVIFESTHLEHSTRLVGAEALMMEALEFLMITVHQEGGDPDMHLRGSGIKVHLMKLIAYLLYRHPGNQRVAKQRGAIALVRQQLTYETANPYLREWAVFTIKNFCENNEDNQKDFAATMFQSANRFNEN